MAPPPTRDSAVLPCIYGCLAFLYRHFPPQSPPSHPLYPSLCSQQQPSHWECSTIPKLQLPAPSRRPFQETCIPAQHMYGCGKDCLWVSFYLGCHGSAVSLSALNVSPLTQTVAPLWGSDPLLQFPHPPRAGPGLLTLLFFPLVPLSYWILHGSIYSFPLVRYSCLLSAGVLHTLLCLKVYSWCIHRERCSPHLPTPPPSCSPTFRSLIYF